MEAPQEQRFRPPVSADCPLFSERLEEHVIAVSRGEAPSRGRFCGNCYTPAGRDTERCSHCDNHFEDGRAAVDIVPDEITEMLRRQREDRIHDRQQLRVPGGVDRRWWPVWAWCLGFRYLRDNLLPATIAYAVILLIGVRGLAGFLGGYYGDRIGYERARKHTIASWKAFEANRDP